MAPTRPSTPPSPYRITVVCLGNICRSPIGEAVLRRRLADAGLAGQVAVDSAGTGTWHTGHPADPRSVDTLLGHGYEPLAGHAARRITSSWFADIDLVLAMDESNYADLERLIAHSGMDPELRMMRAFDASLRDVVEPSARLDVPDPYYGGPSGFVDVLRLIERAADGVVTHARARVEAADRTTTQ